MEDPELKKICHHFFFLIMSLQCLWFPNFPAKPFFSKSISNMLWRLLMHLFSWKLRTSLLKYFKAVSWLHIITDDWIVSIFSYRKEIDKHKQKICIMQRKKEKKSFRFKNNYFFMLYFPTVNTLIKCMFIIKMFLFSIQTKVSLLGTIH